MNDRAGSADGPVLGDVRVLEVSSTSTMFAGQLLADFGADVVVIEPLTGAPGRRTPPFHHDRPGLEHSLLWMSVNRGKRSCTIDPSTPDGRAILMELANRFDVVLYERNGCAGAVFDETVLDGTLRCVFHPFAPDGPKGDYLATELVLSAASGSPALAGRPLGRPLFFPTPQSMFEIGSDAAVAILAALVAPGKREVQRIDVNGRAAMLAAAFSEPLVSGAAGGTVPPEPGARRPTLPTTYRCADGYVLISLVFGTSFDGKMTGLARWLVSEGVAGDDLVSTEWRQLAGRGIDDPTIARIVELVTAAAARSTRDEVAGAASRFGFFAAPVYDMSDIVRSERLRRRGAFVQVQHPLDGTMIDLPVNFARLSECASVATGPVPQLGAHTVDVLREHTDLDDAELSALFAQGVI